MFDQANDANISNQLAIEGQSKGDVKMIEYSNQPDYIDNAKNIQFNKDQQIAITYSNGQGKVNNVQNEEVDDKDKNIVAIPETILPPRMQICKVEAKNNMFFIPEDSYQQIMNLDDVEDKIISKNNTRLPTEFYADFSNYKPGQAAKQKSDQCKLLIYCLC